MQKIGIIIKNHVIQTIERSKKGTIEANEEELRDK